MTIPLTEHFTLEEMTTTRQRGTDGNLIANTPDADELHCLRALCVNVLEPIRSLLGCPVIITSGFRSYDVEMRVSGKDYGQHRRGQAADFVLPANVDIVLAYESIWRSAIPYDQLLLEQSGSTRWIHVSHGPGPQRKQALWSPDNGQRWAYYFPGISQSNEA